ncbi:MAG: hypothetical protein P1U85_15075 [Verrucomicrobiales bacterium]|nr:hypothetical protein [Verrucomicrobiales bacterium]
MTTGTAQLRKENRASLDTRLISMKPLVSGDVRLGENWDLSPQADPDHQH